MTTERIEIEEPSQAMLREARKLLRRKERRASGAFLVEGRQAVREAIRTPGVVQHVFVRWGSAHENLDLVEEARAWEIGVDELAAEDDEVADYVKQLEEARDATDLPEASGEAIAREFERYLRRRGADDPKQP